MSHFSYFYPITTKKEEKNCTIFFKCLDTFQFFHSGSNSYSVKLTQSSHICPPASRGLGYPLFQIFYLNCKTKIFPYTAKIVQIAICFVASKNILWSAPKSIYICPTASRELGYPFFLFFQIFDLKCKNKCANCKKIIVQITISFCFI